LQKIEQGGPVYYQFEQWAGAKALTHAVFTRHGGVSRAPWSSLNIGGTVGDDAEAVQRNVRLVYETLELDVQKACEVWQVHSADAVVAEGPIPGRRWLARADAMVTNKPGVPLLMRFADCVPILFYDSVHHVVGIAHAGWRGTVAQVVVSTVRAMQDAFGTRAEEVQAGIGPSIGPDHYQVGPEVVEAVMQSFGTTQDLIRQTKDGSTYLDLWASNRLALERIGVHSIEAANICTASNIVDFYSHRAEQGKTGRFGAVVALNEMVS
jgi:YfiH family protein